MVGITRWCSRPPGGQAIVKREEPEGFATVIAAVEPPVSGDLPCRLSCAGLFPQMDMELDAGPVATCGADVATRFAATSRKLSRMYSIRSA